MHPLIRKPIVTVIYLRLCFILKKLSKDNTHASKSPISTRGTKGGTDALCSVSERKRYHFRFVVELDPTTARYLTNRQLSTRANSRPNESLGETLAETNGKSRLVETTRDETKCWSRLEKSRRDDTSFGLGGITTRNSRSSNLRVK